MYSLRLTTHHTTPAPPTIYMHHVWPRCRCRCRCPCCGRRAHRGLVCRLLQSRQLQARTRPAPPSMSTASYSTPTHGAGFTGSWCSSAPSAGTAAVICPSPSCTPDCARCIVCAVQALHTQARSRTRAERRRRRTRGPASVGGCCSRADRTTHEHTSTHLRLAPPPLHQHQHHQQHHQHQHHHHLHHHQHHDDRSCSCHCHRHRSLLPPPSPRCVAMTTLTQTRNRWPRCSASTRSGAVRSMGASFDMSSSAGEAGSEASLVVRAVSPVFHDHHHHQMAVCQRQWPPAVQRSRAMPSTGSVPGCATKRLHICA